MKKQIQYPGFILRLFTSSLDLMLLSLVSSPFLNYASQYLCVLIFKDFLLLQNININDINLVAKAFVSEDFGQYINNGHIKDYLIYLSCIFTLNIITAGIFFIGFWKYKGATPGKIILKMRIVDADTLATPTTYQLFKRFAGYATIAFGLWMISFSKKHQALHDKIANTVVIRN